MKYQTDGTVIALPVLPVCIYNFIEMVLAYSTQTVLILDFCLHI